MSHLSKSFILKKAAIIVSMLALFFVMFLTGCSKGQEAKNEDGTQKRLLVYAGAASKPPTEEVAKAFEKKTGVKVDLVFGGSGAVLSQMELSKKGDLYFPGSSDFMEKAIQKGLVYPKTESRIVYLVNSINVQKGNPKNIHSLKDLTKPGIKVAIANPETVCVGLYATEIIDKTFTTQEKEAFKKNLLNYTESCDKTATAISLKTVDAVIGWSVFQDWDPATIETIPLQQDEIQRIGYIPIAVSTFTENKKLSQEFIDFLNSDEGKAIFKKYKYFASAKEAISYIGVEKPVGGEYKLNEEWLNIGK